MKFKVYLTEQVNSQSGEVIRTTMFAVAGEKAKNACLAYGLYSSLVSR